MVVAGFASRADIDRAHEIANEARRTSQQLADCQSLAQKYNSRERQFGADVTNVSQRTSIGQKDFYVV